jgi:hypothetical protein
MNQCPAVPVSIVITSFNYEKFVAAAIRSALDQTYPHLQVIVVDDGSSDGSRRVIESFGDLVLAIYRENGGETAATNTGFAAARGDIVMFLDSDDTLRADAVAEVVAAFRPGVSKVQFCLATIDEAGNFAGNIFPNYPSWLTPDSVRREVLRTGLYPCPPTTGNAYARTYLEQVMPLSTAVFAMGPDGPLNTAAPFFGDVATIDEPLGNYRVHGGNMWAQQVLRPEMFRDYVLHDCKRGIFLRWHALLRGQVIVTDPLQHAVLHLQYRLASARLGRARHPIAAEGVLTILGWGLRAVCRAPERASAKLALLLWFLGVALAPRGLAEYLVALRFVPSRRPHVLRHWLTRLSILRPLRSVMEARLAPTQPSPTGAILPPQPAEAAPEPHPAREPVQAPLAAALPRFPEGGRSDATT